MQNMKHLQYIFIALCTVFTLLTSSCSNDEIGTNETTEVPESPTAIDGVTASVDRLTEGTFTPSTRSSYIYEQDSKGQYILSFSWLSGDKIHLYSTEEGKAEYTLTKGENQSTATFNGTGFDLTPNAVYYGFSNKQDEINPENNKMKLYADYRGLKQIGNSNSEHLGAYDFSYAKATAQENKSAHFDFKHLGSVLVFELTVPETGEFTEITLDDKLSKVRKLYQPRQVVDITENDPYFAKDLENMVGTMDDPDNTYKLLLRQNKTDETGISLQANGILQAFIWLPTCDLSGQTLRIIAKTKEGKEYYATCGSGKMVKGNYYRIKRTLAKSQELLINLKVNKAWQLGNTVSQTRAGDPGIDEEMPYPTKVAIFTCLNGKIIDKKVFDNLGEQDWLISKDICSLKHSHIVGISETPSNGKINVYAYAYKEAPTLTEPEEGDTENSLQALTFSTQDQLVMRDAYSVPYVTPGYTGEVAYSSTAPMAVDLTLYHVAAKMDIQWDFTTALSGNVSVNGIQGDNISMFKPTMNGTTGFIGTTTWTATNAITPGTQWIGRQVFYIPQLADKTYNITLGTAANNVTFTNPVTNGWTSWLKANITPAPPAP